MKTRTILLTLVFCLAGAALSFAKDANLGTWKLNEAKSKIPAGAGKNTSVVYTMQGSDYKCVVDGVDASGNPIHNEWVGKFDGKDYPLTGDPTDDSRSIRLISQRHYTLTNKKDGKTTVSGTIEISPDLKTRTVTTHSTGANGKKMTTVFVYDRE